MEKCLSGVGSAWVWSLSVPLCSVIFVPQAVALWQENSTGRSLLTPSLPRTLHHPQLSTPTSVGSLLEAEEATVQAELVTRVAGNEAGTLCEPLRARRAG